ncbi:MAG: hypothetical protein CO108_29720 [Deltaproteobacteria bacterium CG_4_9_14_3_um_filter_63_12]|nr:MAG: hypothetical protein CO108_29720 [Deltaproteobacteria bacterium CG_4_9_14_3_um_filter_63_12]
MEIFTETECHPLPDGEVRVLGAVRCVTGAMTRVEMGGRKLLIDCGKPQGNEARGWSFPQEAADSDALILTHGHFDHVGAIGDLWKKDWTGPILGTRATLDIARIVLEDSCHLTHWSPKDTKIFLEWYDSSTKALRYDHPDARIDGFDGTLVLREAGHILGSASVELVSPLSRVILSGDLGRPETPILRDPNRTWDDSRPVDFVLMESTYGNRVHETEPEEVEAKLLEVIRWAQEQRGHIIVPAFAIGRTQTLLYHLNALVESGRVDGLPVAVDTPMGLNVTATYQRFKPLFDREALELYAHGDDPFVFEDLYAVNRGRDSAKLDDVEGPMLIIAGSGMCTGGRVVRHLQELLPDPRTTVLFVGYQADGTPGRRIQEAAKDGGSVWLSGEDVVVKAKIETLSGLSAHADGPSLAAWFKSIPGVKRVGFHHGDPEAQRGLAELVRGGLS